MTKLCKESSPRYRSGITHAFSSSAEARRCDCSFIQYRHVCEKTLAKLAWVISKSVQENMRWARCLHFDNMFWARSGPYGLQNRELGCSLSAIFPLHDGVLSRFLLRSVKVRLCTLTKAMTTQDAWLVHKYATAIWSSCGHTDLFRICLHTDKVMATDCLSMVKCYQHQYVWSPFLITSWIYFWYLAKSAFWH